MSYSLPTGLGGPFQDENSQRLLYKIAAYLGASLSGSSALAVTGSFSPAPASPTSAFGLTKFRNSAVTNSAVAIKASAGNVFSIRAQSPAGNVLPTYLQSFDAAAASAVPGTTSPATVLEDTAISSPNTGQLLIVAGSYPVENFSTAISVLATSVLSDSGTQTAPTAAVLVEISYA